MPISLRKKGKTSKIAESVLDSPQLYKKKKARKTTQKEQKLSFEESRRV